jgi:hypothetical protein
MDPAMMGADPAMMGADPAMMGGAPVDPAAEEAAAYDMLVQAVRQVLSEMGIEPKEEKGEGDSESKSDGESKSEGKGDRLTKLENTVNQIAMALGLPTDGGGDEDAGGGPDAATGMSAGSGMPSDGAGAMPMMGPLDPMAGAGMADVASLSGSPMPSPTEMQMPKGAGFRPADPQKSVAGDIAAAMRKLRS